MTTLKDRNIGLNGFIAWKPPVLVATTENITLSGLQTIDDVLLVKDDRVLVKDQTDASENGIYSAKGGAWTRALDFNGARDIATGTSVIVTSGTLGAFLAYTVSTAGDITIGTTDLTFVVSRVLGDDLVIGVDAQAYDATVLTPLAGLTPAANKIPRFTGASSVDLVDVSATGLLVMDIASYTALLAAITPLTTAGDLMHHSGGVSTRLALGGSRDFLRVNSAGTGLEYNGHYTFIGDTALSGTAVNFSGWGSDVLAIHIHAYGVSTSGTSGLAVRLGDSGGIESSGYTGAVRYANVSADSFDNEFQLATSVLAAESYDVMLTLRRYAAGQNRWTIDGVCGNTGTALSWYFVGSKETSTTLTQIDFTTIGGSDTFDAGQINVSYEI